eukprot:11100494-Alexandrium_andersonii.AAC.1
MSASLVGSEMCIRDSPHRSPSLDQARGHPAAPPDSPKRSGSSRESLRSSPETVGRLSGVLRRSPELFL